ncbi:MAG: formimidoylglutamase [Bdellovibrionia bacterium]
MSKRIKFCIIGIPDHQGVLALGGRLGSAQGPEAFRKAFVRLKGRVPLKDWTQDCGDVPGITFDVALNHKKASQYILGKTLLNRRSVIIGGSHDHGYSHLDGIYRFLAKHSKVNRPRIGCINIDAHLDLRKPAPVISSGSPFYLALESGILHPKRFIEFGIQSHCNAPELWDYADTKKVEIVPFCKLRHGTAVKVFEKKLKKLCAQSDAVVISLDLDALASAYAPGVSAPQSEGFTAMEIIEMMEIAGRQKKVISLGIFELNPEHDEDNKTARLAATAAYHFLEASSEISEK